ncbi:MAG: FHA domain-containing protein, partial [Myxococcota bacterium]
MAEQRRSERNAPFSEGPDEGSASGSRTSGDTREVTGGAAVVDAGFDGFRQPTAMFDKGEFLGELAELVDGAPATRAKVEAGVKPPLGCRLIIVSGPDLGLEWSFKSKEVVIGRDEDCQLVMQDIAVSRRHARIAFKGDHFMLTDLGSGNGTF